MIKSYNADLSDFIIPPSVVEAGFVEEFKKIMKKTEILAKKLRSKQPLLENYILTNAHTTDVLFNINLRELYHFSRLRCDKHSQWEIREVASKMVKAVKAFSYVSTKYLMGKDRFIEERQS